MSEIRFSARRARVAGVLALLLLGMASSAYAVSATLSVTPSPVVKPGDALTFTAQVAYQNPAPVVSVYLGGTMWTTELQTVKYPTPGQIGTVTFSKTYTVSDSAKNGSTLCFVVAAGGGNVDIKQPISEKTCITVKYTLTVQKGPATAQLNVKPLLPDLVVSDVHIDQSNAKIVRAKVVNSGVGTAPASVLCVQVRLWSGGGSKQLANKQVSVKALKSGESVSIAVDTGVMGSFFYELTADCTGVVSESNETNNKATLDRTIK